MSAIFKPLAFISATLVGALGVLSTKSRKARYYFNLSMYVGALGFASFLGVVYGIALSLVGQRLNINYLTARSFYHICSPLIGINIVVEGREHLDALKVLDRDGKSTGKRRSAVLLGNHQTFVDILYLGRIFPTHSAIMAKRSLKMTPLLGQFMTLSGTVFIDRGNREDAVKLMDRAGEEMKRKGISLFVFPEGTRTSSPQNNMLPFKKGAFHLAVQAKVPIIPIVCENYNRLFDGKTRFDRGTLRLRILPPIETADLTGADVNHLAVTVRESMLEALNEISVDAPSSSSSDSATRPLLDRSPSSADSNTPLNPESTRKDSNQYGAAVGGNGMSMTRSISDGEVRRRSSQQARELDADEMTKNDQKETAEEGKKVEREKEGNATESSGEDEVDEEGAVLIQRPA